MSDNVHITVDVSKRGFWAGQNAVMGITALSLIVVFLIFTLLDSEQAGQFFLQAKTWLQRNLSWYYVLIVNISLIFSLWLLFGRYSQIRLGGEAAKPDFSTFSWFAMLFSAAVGIGLMFFSIAEPIFHLQNNPFLSASTSPEEAAVIALRLTFFHWGLHGWAIYALVGLSLAYFSYNKGLPLTIRSALYPVFGKRLNGGFGHAVDLLSVFGTVFGTATTLGLGVSQMNAGFNYLWGIEISTLNQVLLIGGVTLLATLSAVSGVEKGMRILSEWNIRLSILLLIFFFVAGPSVYVLGSFVTGIGDYIHHLIPLGFWVDSDTDSSWQGDWTLFYWGWWIAWGPFVGMFIARISRGRTIREFLTGAILVPTLLAFIWLAIFGGTALQLELVGGAGVAQAVNADMTLALYKTLEMLDVGWVTVVAAYLITALIITWFVTSADSGTLVVCTVLGVGNTHAGRRFRVLWGTSQGLIAAVLLIAGGLAALKSMSTVLALPFSIIFLLMLLSLVMVLRSDERAALHKK